MSIDSKCCESSRLEEDEKTRSLQSGNMVSVMMHLASLSLPAPWRLWNNIMNWLGGETEICR